MVQNIFLQMNYKIIQYLYQLDIIIGLVKMVSMVKLNRGGDYSFNYLTIHFSNLLKTKKYAFSS